ncbi:hypothetical protein, partial [Lysinibacillus fusiformis]|uniref:hypothetical protein n=1 Tax=Lysinibacillus fusiformis TaxID=28031 RepID=UPI0020C0B690
SCTSMIANLTLIIVIIVSKKGVFHCYFYYSLPRATYDEIHYLFKIKKSAASNHTLKNNSTIFDKDDAL